MAIHATPRILKIVLAFIASAGIAASLIGAAANAQTPGHGNSAPATPPRATAARSVAKPDATLLQLMRGVLYPASNVIFAAQSDLSAFTRPEDPSTSPNPITSTYGGWDAVENASLALTEASRLVLVTGRVCSNGKMAPVQRADWQQFAEALRQAGLKSYKAAQTKNTDNMLDAADAVSDACAKCHQMYREKPGGDKDRCLP
jgi:hypothetical protein